MRQPPQWTPEAYEREARHKAMIENSPWITRGGKRLTKRTILACDLLLRYLERNGGRVRKHRVDIAAECDLSPTSFDTARKLLIKLGYIRTIDGRTKRAWDERRLPDWIIQIRPSEVWRENYAQHYYTHNQAEAKRRYNARYRAKQKVFEKSLIDQIARDHIRLDLDPYAAMGEREIDDAEVDAWGW